MKRRFFLEILQSSFWLLPGLLALCLMGLSPLIGLVQVEPSSPLASFLLIGKQSEEGGRLLLTSIATASMTVVGVLFSVVILVLQQVSSQFTPRTIETFIRSTASQVVLGFYVGTFGFTMLALRSVGVDPEGADSVPPYFFKVTVAVVLAMACLGLLIFYIHHISKSIESHNILAEARNNCIATLREIESDYTALPPPFAFSTVEAGVVRAEKAGYLQEIRWEEIPGKLPGPSWQLELTVMPGDFIYPGMELARLFPVMDEATRELPSVFKIGIHRTEFQDPRFGVKQIADIAVRALSPGINDPSTAVEAVQELGIVLHHFTGCCVRSALLMPRPGCLLKLKQLEYRELVGLCYDQILLSGKEFPLVLRAVRTALQHCREAALAGKNSLRDRAALLEEREAEVSRLLAELEERSPVALLAS